MTHGPLREYWRELKRGRPGRRFVQRYERARRDHQSSGGTARRVAFIAAGLVCVAVGGFFAIFPGPALPFFFLGGGLLATESRTLARFMDWSELRIREIGAWAKRHWRRLPIAGRIAVVILGVCCSAAGTYFSYRLFHG